MTSVRDSNYPCEQPSSWTLRFPSSPLPGPAQVSSPSPASRGWRGSRASAGGRGTSPGWVYSQRNRRNLPHSPFSPTRSPRAQGPPWATPCLSGRIRRPLSDHIACQWKDCLLISDQLGGVSAPCPPLPSQNHVALGMSLSP